MMSPSFAPRRLTTTFPGGSPVTATTLAGAALSSLARRQVGMILDGSNRRNDDGAEARVSRPNSIKSRINGATIYRASCTES
jgi:hypothetical protein